MKYYAYIRNSLYANYCKEREETTKETYDRDEFMKGFLTTVGTTGFCTELQPYCKESDMFWCFVEIKNGWSIRLINEY